VAGINYNVSIFCPHVLFAQVISKQYCSSDNFFGTTVMEMLETLPWNGAL